MPFGEVVCGSPGSGKSTYCYGKYQLFTALNRPIAVVNLDPANENIPYPCAIDIASLITVEDVMEEHGLGPNGGMLYCMEYLEANYDWLQDRLKELGDVYILFDLPGQVELSTNHDSVKNIIKRLTKNGFRVCRYDYSCRCPRVRDLLWPAGRGPPVRCALCNGRIQVYFGPDALPSHDAASRAATCQCPLQGRSHNAVRRSG